MMRKTFKRIALIDDDPIINLIHTKIITKSTDFQVIAYTNAQKAVEQFDTWSYSEPDQLPDVIFLDINMPVMDGWLGIFRSISENSNCCRKKMQSVYAYLINQ